MALHTIRPIFFKITTSLAINPHQIVSIKEGTNISIIRMIDGSQHAVHTDVTEAMRVSHHQLFVNFTDVE